VCDHGFPIEQSSHLQRQGVHPTAAVSAVRKAISECLTTQPGQL
jgi:hypothetical protein